MKYFLIAGERSGDLHGSWLVKALLHQDPDARIYAFGGDYMKKEGAHVLSHYKEASFMGFWEVVKNAGVIRRRFKTCRQAIEDIRPDILILIDYPGFNLRMARYARQQGIKTLYYISPKIWAWKKGRIRQIRAFVDRMCVIFPFEVGFYRSLDYPVTYVGNPLVEQVDGFRFSDLNELPDYDTTIAFLPGSRQQEVATSVQMIMVLAERMQHSLLLVAGVDNLDPAVYVPLSGKENIRVVVGKTYEVLKRSQAAVVTSGTATLETALLGVPQVVCYRTSALSYEIGKRVVNVRYISLVNLIIDRPLVRELIQDEYRIENVVSELDRLLNDGQYRGEMLDGYSQIRQVLGNEPASVRTAEAVMELIRQP